MYRKSLCPQPDYCHEGTLNRNVFHFEKEDDNANFTVFNSETKDQEAGATCSYIIYPPRKYMSMGDLVTIYPILI
jgi:hypothetical protein